jgi:subtilisin
MDLNTQLKMLGVAEVMAVLKSANGEAQKGAKAIAEHFRPSGNSHDAALLETLRTTAKGKAAAALPKKPEPFRVYPHLGIVLGTVDKEGLAKLRKDNAVSKVLPAPVLSLIRPTASDAAKAKKGITWGIQALNVPKLWKGGCNGMGVLVGHLDTGVDGKHPALKGAIGAFAEFDLLGQQVANAKAHDTDEHGTHTAGTIAGRAVSGVSFGVAPGAKLASAIVIEGGNVVARILGGMNWVVGKKVRILSMSLGLRGYDGSFLFLVQLLRRLNILPVFAVGNEGSGTSRSPGNYAEVLSVGAYNEKGQVALFSSSQRFNRPKDPIVPDLVGPGVDVLSCIPNGRYALMSGSSMATPHIAGLAALLMQAKPKATATQIESAIFRSCRLLTGMTPDRANQGVPDAIKALSFL